MHEAVKHSIKEYVRGQAHTNGMEYVTEFSRKHNLRDSGTLAQMTALVAGLVGKRLIDRDLIADNGLSSGSRS